MAGIAVWFALLTVAVPFAGALLVRLQPLEAAGRQQRLAAVAALLTALAAAATSLVRADYRCVFAPPREQCLWEQSTSIFLVAVSLLLAWRLARTERPAGRPRIATILLLMLGAVAATVEAENLFVWFVALNLLLYVLYRWFRLEGIAWHILLLPVDDEERK